MSKSNLSSKKILFVLTGSIAAYKACEVISRLAQAGHEVQVVATASALKFIGTATLEGLTGKSVAHDLFASGQAMDHIYLARWCDLVMVCPASANWLNRTAAGLAEDLVGSLMLAMGAEKPKLIAPAMNTQMFAHPKTQDSLTTLQRWGYQILPTNHGELACGEVGEGRLLEPELIFAAIQTALHKCQSPLNILITYGGTEAPIDGVRHISNFSSGRTGAVLTDYLRRRGHRVSVLRAHNSQMPVVLGQEYIFRTHCDLENLLKEQLKNSYDSVIHLAAVSDFSVANPPTSKLESDNEITLRLKPTRKIIDQLKSFSSNPLLTIIGFKLTRGLSENEQHQAVNNLLQRSRADFIVHNAFEKIDSTQHHTEIYGPQGLWQTATSKQQLAQSLELLLLQLHQPTDTARSSYQTTQEHWS